MHKILCISVTIFRKRKGLKLFKFSVFIPKKGRRKELKGVNSGFTCKGILDCFDSTIAKTSDGEVVLNEVRLKKSLFVLEAKSTKEYHQ